MTPGIEAGRSPETRKAPLVRLPPFLAAVLAAGCGASADAAPAGAAGAAGLDASGGTGGGDSAAPGDAAEAGLDSATSTVPGWSCLGKVKPPPAPTTATATVTFELEEYPTPNAAAAVTVRACAKADPSCAAPLAVATTDATGKATADLPLGAGGFDGYFDLVGAAYPETLAFRSAPITGDTPKVRLALVTASTRALFYSGAGVAVDASRGTILGRVADCAGGFAAGGSVALASADATTVTFYLAAGVPSVAAGATDASGAAGFLAVREGPFTVTTTASKLGVVAGTLEGFVKAGAVTLVSLAPTP
jgi:hypothetical protein